MVVTPAATFRAPSQRRKSVAIPPVEIAIGTDQGGVMEHRRRWTQGFERRNSETIHLTVAMKRLGRKSGLSIVTDPLHSHLGRRTRIAGEKVLEMTRRTEPGGRRVNASTNVPSTSNEYGVSKTTHCGPNAQCIRSFARSSEPLFSFSKGSR
jgi:hypothetical protein